MKKRICMAMAAMLAVGSVPAYAADLQMKEVPVTFTAEVGTTNFKKNGEAQPLDVPVYIKDDYVMLPLRTFMQAADKTAQMQWDGSLQRADAVMGNRTLTFDAQKNAILVNGANLPVSGKMDIRDGRLFVPIRNWGMILEAVGYKVEADAIHWNQRTQTATIYVTGEIREEEPAPEPPAAVGEGQAPAYAMELTTDYDEIKNIGDGYFIAQKYKEKNVGLGELIGSPENTYFLLDGKGEEVLKYESGTIDNLEDLGEGCLLVRERYSDKEYVIDRTGKTLFKLPAEGIYPFSEGLARLEDDPRGGKYDGDFGFIDKSGNIVIPINYMDAEDFSEGLAAVRTDDGWGYIDKKGNWVIEPQYRWADSFSEGLARVKMGEKKYFYIDKKGNPISKESYCWGNSFHNGTAFVVVEEDTARYNTWLIDKTGKKVRLIAEGEYTTSADAEGVIYREEIVDLPGDHQHVFTYYDTNGEISVAEYNRRKNLAEGLAPVWDAEAKKYGYVDANGKQVIAPVFGKAETFKDGYAVVANEIRKANGSVDVEWGIIKKP